MLIRKLTEADVTFTIECEDEDMPVRGAFASGDDEADLEDEKRILAELERGNNWAWCCVHVRASWRDFHGDDYLGGCSYASQEDFESNGGYLDDMKANALEELNKNVAHVAEQLLALTI
jgi:hypothetical protein